VGQDDVLYNKTPNSMNYLHSNKGELVFISAKSEDCAYAQQIYDFLIAHGVPTFYSQESLPKLGNSDYRREIDKSLDNAHHMIVVVSSVKNALSPWVEAEWGFFINEKRSGRKTGNLITVTIGSLQHWELPPSLRYYEVILFEPHNIKRILYYVSGNPRESQVSEVSLISKTSKEQQLSEDVIHSLLDIAKRLAAQGNETGALEIYRQINLLIPQDSSLGISLKSAQIEIEKNLFKESKPQSKDIVGIDKEITANDRGLQSSIIGLETAEETPKYKDVFICGLNSENNKTLELDELKVVQLDSAIIIGDYLKPAQCGNVNAQFILGRIYEKGYGVDIDLIKAERWYDMAAEQGNASAQNNLGWMYEKGIGVNRDYEKAMNYYRKAAKAGNASAQNNLGWMYQNGYGTEMEYKEAIKWYQLAAEQGDAVAQNNLGWMYQNGYGVERNYNEALRLYLMAAEQGNAVAQNNLGLMYQNGYGIEKDITESAKWFQKAIVGVKVKKHIHMESQNVIGWMYLIRID
jgi:TPR repeat protein